MQCRVIIYCNSHLCFILTRQQETIKEPLAFALSGRELLRAIFHRALPCAMGLLPRWGVKKFAATYKVPTPFIE
jgi:hypothetical protein